MIYTSYFANDRHIPADIIRISICSKAPSWYTGLQYKTLAPKYGFFMKWKSDHDNESYTKSFKTEVLEPLNVDTIIKELYSMTNGLDIVLLCYEKSTDFCHRHIVADWLCSETRIVKEYK